MITKPIAPILESKISGFSLRLNASSRSYSISCCTNRSHGHVGAQFLFISWVAASSEHDSARIMYARMNAADLQCTTSSELCTSAQRKRGRVQLPEDIAWMLHLPPRRCTGGRRGGNNVPRDRGMAVHEHRTPAGQRIRDSIGYSLKVFPSIPSTFFASAR